MFENINVSISLFHMNNLKANQFKYTNLMIITFLATRQWKLKKACISNKSINFKNLYLLYCKET